MSFLQWPLYAQLLVLAGICGIAYSLVSWKGNDIIRWNPTSRASRQRKAEARGCEPTLRKASPFFGLAILRENIKHLRNHTVLEQGAKGFVELGSNTFQVGLLGNEITCTIEPANVQAILATDFNSFCLGKARAGLSPLLGEGIFVSDGAAWRHSRDLLRPNFSRAQIADTDLFERHVENLLRAMPSDGSTIDLAPLFFGVTFDLASEFLFNESTNILATKTPPPEVTRFVEAWDRSTDALGAGGGRLGMWSLFFTDPQFTRDCKTVHGMSNFKDRCNTQACLEADGFSDFADSLVRKFIAKRSATGPPERYSFLGELLEQTTSPIKLRTELLNVLLAGRETTAALLINLFFTLSRRPDIQARLRAEIATLSVSDTRSLEQIKNLRYVRAFINESLRLYPLVPANQRQAQADTTFPVGGGKDSKSPCFIAKGDLVSWSLYVMHRRKDIFGEDAEEFKPERWIDEEGRKGIRPGWAYLPFNGGPRICIGRKLFLSY